MPEISFDNLGIGGIIRDRAGHTLAPEFWTGGKNVRFVKGRAEKAKGSQEVLIPVTVYDPAGTLKASGTNTSTGGSLLIDSGATFVTAGIVPGQWVVNGATSARTTVKSVDAETQLTLYADIFPSSPVAYTVRAGNTNPALWLMPWREVTTSYWLACMDQKILRITADTFEDVTRTASDYATDTTKIWSGGVIGGLPVLNHDKGDDPQGWDSGTGKFVDLVNWPANTTARIMRVFKQYLVAMDITVSGTRQPHTIKWSSPALPGSYPSYWDNAITNDSNESPLSEGGGFIIDAARLGNINLIYKEELTYSMEHVGGQYVFAFRQLPFATGLYAPRCVKDFFGKHFVVTRGDVILHNGQEATSIIDNKNRDYLFDNMAIGKERATFVVPNYAANEMWICFVSNSVNGSFADEVMIYNWKDQTWGHRALGQVGGLGGVPHIGFGLLDKTAVSQFIDDQSQFIENDASFIDAVTDAAGKMRMLGSMENTTTYKLVEFDITDAEQTNVITSYVERTDLAIVGHDRQGNPKVDPASTKFVRRVYPKVEATNALNIYVGSQQKLGGSVTYFGPFAFNPETDDHIDCRVQGKAIAIKIESTTDASWHCTGFVLDLEIIGKSVR